MFILSTEETNICPVRGAGSKYCEGQSQYVFIFIRMEHTPLCSLFLSIPTAEIVFYFSVQLPITEVVWFLCCPILWSRVQMAALLHKINTTAFYCTIQARNLETLARFDEGRVRDTNAGKWCSISNSIEVFVKLWQGFIT